MHGLIGCQAFLPRSADGCFVLSGDDVLADGRRSHQKVEPGSTGKEAVGFAGFPVGLVKLDDIFQGEAFRSLGVAKVKAMTG